MECTFCRIIKGELPSYLIYEDEFVKVLLDINPVTNGHTLIVPKEHYDNVLDLPDEIDQHIHNLTKNLYRQYKDKLGIEGLTIINNNELGQDIKHYHLHLIPRYFDDTFVQSFNNSTPKPLSEITNMINN